MARRANTPEATSSRDSASLQALFRLSSASLPVGGYSYSQGLESAVNDGRVTNLVGLKKWLLSALDLWPKNDALLWALIYSAIKTRTFETLVTLNRIHWASRDVVELRAETEQMGWSLVRLLSELNWLEGDLQSCLLKLDTPTFLTAHASACYAKKIRLEDGLVSFCFTFVEGQIQAAQKLLPIGQAAGQGLLGEIQPHIDQCIEKTLSHLHAGEACLHTAAPMQAILCARHEFQYSRLFRS
jgi:urease accessory protein